MERVVSSRPAFGGPNLHVYIYICIISPSTSQSGIPPLVKAWCCCWRGGYTHQRSKSKLLLLLRWGVHPLASSGGVAAVAACVRAFVGVCVCVCGGWLGGWVAGLVGGWVGWVGWWRGWGGRVDGGVGGWVALDLCSRVARLLCCRLTFPSLVNSPLS